MKILVCGGRDFNDNKMLADVLYGQSDKHRITCLIHGGARGADSLAGAWARHEGIQEVICPANWDLHGKAAGVIRNKAMLKLKPGLVIAFPGGKGTLNMKREAQFAGVPVLDVFEDGQSILIDPDD